jgi:hypothetical protein
LVLNGFHGPGYINIQGYDGNSFIAGRDLYIRGCTCRIWINVRIVRHIEIENCTNVVIDNSYAGTSYHTGTLTIRNSNVRFEGGSEFRWANGVISWSTVMVDTCPWSITGSAQLNFVHITSNEPLSLPSAYIGNCVLQAPSFTGLPPTGARPGTIIYDGSTTYDTFVRK